MAFASPSAAATHKLKCDADPAPTALSESVVVGASAAGGAGSAPTGTSVPAAQLEARLVELDAEIAADRAAIIKWHRTDIDKSLSQGALLQLYRAAELSEAAQASTMQLERQKQYIAAYRAKAA